MKVLVIATIALTACGPGSLSWSDNEVANEPAVTGDGCYLENGTKLEDACHLGILVCGQQEHAYAWGSTPHTTTGRTYRFVVEPELIALCVRCWKVCEERFQANVRPVWPPRVWWDDDDTFGWQAECPRIVLCN